MEPLLSKGSAHCLYSCLKNRNHFTPPVITVSAQLDKDVQGNSGYPITIEVKKIKILKAGLAEVETDIYIHSSDIFWRGKFTVTETDGKWTVILNKRKAGISLINVYT